MIRTGKLNGKLLNVPSTITPTHETIEMAPLAKSFEVRVFVVAGGVIQVSDGEDAPDCARRPTRWCRDLRECFSVVAGPIGGVTYRLPQHDRVG